MNQLTREHITALFVVATYHWLVGSHKEAEYILSIAVLIADRKSLVEC